MADRHAPAVAGQPVADQPVAGQGVADQPVADRRAPAAGGVVGIGIDSVDVARLAMMLDRRPALLDRLWTAGERADVAAMANPVPSLAGRFAVKEAVMKALGVGLGAFAWGEVETARLAGGAPQLVVSGRAAVLAAERGVGGWRLSITHTASVASAVVAALA